MTHPATSSAVVRPTLKFMLAHPAHLIALGFGSGLPRLAPGTFGTLWAWLSYLALQAWLPGAAIGWLILASLPIGWWACTRTARDMGIADPGHIVWDEVVAFWLVLWLAMPMGWVGQTCAFALFRFFDAAKPGPVKWADGLMKQRGVLTGDMRWGPAGFGILFDDLVAAFCTLLVIAGWRWW